MTVKADPVDFMKATMDLNGISYGSVKDGAILMVTKAKLLSILAAIEAKGADRACIFIKQPDVRG